MEDDRNRTAVQCPYTACIPGSLPWQQVLQYCGGKWLKKIRQKAQKLLQPKGSSVQDTHELQILCLVTRLQGNCKNLRNSYRGMDISPLRGEPPSRQVPKMARSKHYHRLQPR